MISSASIWEVEIKRAKGRLTAPDGLRDEVDAAGFQELPITGAHAETAGRLPLLHHDPFDRMLIAQAGVEGLTLMTSDRSILEYEVAVLPFRAA